MTAHVNGIDLFYRKTGNGRPLIMVHGNGENHSIFDEAVEILKDHFTCYCVDSRGHGQSTPAVELHYRDMAVDMSALLETLDLSDVVFYGFSDGGIIGLMTAAECSRISTLIVSGANLNPRGVKLPLRLLFHLLYLLKRDPKIRLMMREPDIGDALLRKISAKTLVLAGSRDLVTEAQTRHIADTIPGAALRILDGEDHGSYIVHSQKIAEIILGFAGEKAK